MIYRMKTQNGTLPVIRQYTAGGASAIDAGDVVALSSDAVILAADEAVVILGWAMESLSAVDAAAGKPIRVMEANDNTIVEMPFSGAAGSVGGYYGLDVTNGVQTVNMADTTNDLFKLIAITRNGTATGHTAGDLRCFVMVPSGKGQGGSGTVEA